MAKVFFALSIYCYASVIYASAPTTAESISAFSDILDDSTLCEGKCTKSFSPHTYPNGSDNEACMRGCRFYTITSITTSDDPEHTNTIDDNGLTPAIALCHQSCIEAYNETSSSTAACKVGCDTQELLSKDKKEKDEGEGGSIHLLQPVMQIREVVSRAVGMIRIFQSTLTTYFLQDDNKLVAVKGPTEVMVELIPPSLVELETKDHDVEGQENNLSESLASNGATSIEFISRKVGVPPYLLIISLLSFIIFLSYVLFITCSSYRKKTKKMKTSFPMPSHALPVKLVRPEDLTKLSLMDEEESHAPGLSSKLKMPDSTNI